MLMFCNPFAYSTLTAGRALCFKRGVWLVEVLKRSFKAFVFMMTVTAAKELTLRCVSCTTGTFSPIMLLTELLVSFLSSV